MRHRKIYVRPSQPAQVLVMFSIALSALLGAMALSTDVAALYFNWQTLQSAADSAVVAGANYLPSNPAQAISTANSYAGSNRIAAPEILSTTVSSDNRSLNIQLQRKVPYTFALLLGLVSGTVSAQATAQIHTIGKTVGVTPIGIDYRTSYSAGQPVTLIQGQVGPGNWGPLALGGSGRAICRRISNMATGAPCRMAIYSPPRLAWQAAQSGAPSTTSSVKG